MNSGGASKDARGAAEIPAWDPAVCTQCGKCVIACPHGAIRARLIDQTALGFAPVGFQSRKALPPEWRGRRYTLQISPANCTGCGICVEVCPVRHPIDNRLKALHLRREAPWHATSLRDWDFSGSLPEAGLCLPPPRNVRSLQLREPFLDAGRVCAGCGQTPYLHLISRLFGGHAVIARGARPPRDSRCSRLVSAGDAEAAVALRDTLERQRTEAAARLEELAPAVGRGLAAGILRADQRDEAGIAAQRRRIGTLNRRLRTIGSPASGQLAALAHAFIRRSIWAIVDERPSHFGRILDSGRDVNVLVLDGNPFDPGSDSALELAAIQSGRAYVASVAMGARDDHAVQAFVEADAHDGPALIVALSPCVERENPAGIRMQRAAVDCGAWLLFRHDPDAAAFGVHPFRFDSPQPRLPADGIPFRGDLETTRSGRRTQEAIDLRWRQFHDISRSRSGKPMADHS